MHFKELLYGDTSPCFCLSIVANYCCSQTCREENKFPSRWFRSWGKPRAQCPVTGETSDTRHITGGL